MANSDEEDDRAHERHRELIQLYKVLNERTTRERLEKSFAALAGEVLPDPLQPTITDSSTSPSSSSGPNPNQASTQVSAAPLAVFSPDAALFVGGSPETAHPVRDLDGERLPSVPARAGPPETSTSTSASIISFP